MKGLLRKDVYVLFQASRAQLLIVLLFLVISMTMNNTLIAYMLALYAAMMPITVISLDERSRFDRFALALPWSRAQIVLSKYALSLAAACLAALSYLAGVLTLGSAVNGGISLQDALTTFCAMLTIGTLLPALMGTGRIFLAGRLSLRLRRRADRRLRHAGADRARKARHGKGSGRANLLHQPHAG